jgi:hypothetical protein
MNNRGQYLGIPQEEVAVLSTEYLTETYSAHDE